MTTLKGNFLCKYYKKLYGKPTLRLVPYVLLRCFDCCDSWCWCSLPVHFLFPEHIGNGERLGIVFMERFHEYERVIHVPPTPVGTMTRTLMTTSGTCRNVSFPYVFCLEC